MVAYKLPHAAALLVCVIDFTVLLFAHFADMTSTRQDKQKLCAQYLYDVTSQRGYSREEIRVASYDNVLC